MLAPEVLANLLETDDNNCKTGALRILRKVTIHPAIRFVDASKRKCKLNDLKT